MIRFFAGNTAMDAHTRAQNAVLAACVSWKPSEPGQSEGSIS